LIENWKLKIENSARVGRGAVGLLSLHPNGRIFQETGEGLVGIIFLRKTYYGEGEDLTRV